MAGVVAATASPWCHGAAALAAPVPGDTYRSGLDAVLAAPPPGWRGRRLGLLSHAAARTSDGRTAAEALLTLSGTRFVRLFLPEHGFGPAPLPPGLRLSRLGDTRAPRPDEWAGLDGLVIDLQDVGCRTYTYGPTMERCLQSAVKARKPVWVLDRPNPLGNLAEGPWQGPSLGSPLVSLPLRHGLTLGEWARLANARGPRSTELHVVPVAGWRSATLQPRSGRTWQAPSPALDTFEAAQRYCGLCLFEATNVRCRLPGRAFAFFGAPWADGRRLAALAASAGLPGVSFRPERVGHDHGVRVVVTSPDAYRPLETALVLLTAFRRCHPGRLALNDRMLIALSGSPDLPGSLRRGRSWTALAADWRREGQAFEAFARPYRLYGR